jgi:hypothetical protein
LKSATDGGVLPNSFHLSIEAPASINSPGDRRLLAVGHKVERREAGRVRKIGIRARRDQLVGSGDVAAKRRIVQSRRPARSRSRGMAKCSQRCALRHAAFHALVVHSGSSVARAPTRPGERRRSAGTAVVATACAARMPALAKPEA